MEGQDPSKKGSFAGRFFKKLTRKNGRGRPGSPTGGSDAPGMGSEAGTSECSFLENEDSPFAKGLVGPGIPVRPANRRADEDLPRGPSVAIDDNPELQEGSMNLGAVPSGDVQLREDMRRYTSERKSGSNEENSEECEEIDLQPSVNEDNAIGELVAAYSGQMGDLFKQIQGKQKCPVGPDDGSGLSELNQINRDATLSMGLDPADADGVTPLFAAVVNSHLEVAQVLTDLGAEVNRGNKQNGHRPLHLACNLGNLEMARLLVLKSGADISATDKKSWTPLMFAVQGENVEVVKFLLECGADVNARGKGNVTALMIGVRSNSKEMVETLAEAGAEIDAHDEDGWSALHFAAKEDVPVAVLALIQAGADVDARDQQRQLTPLHVASDRGIYSTMKILLEHGAAVNAVSEAGATPMIEVLGGCKTELVRLLLDHGANIDVKNDRNGVTSLMAAAMKQNHDVMEWCIAAGCNIEAADKDEQRAMHHAARHGAIECVDVLLRAGADINALAKGEGVLIFAVRGGHYDVARMLMERGAELNSSPKDDPRITLVHALAIGTSPSAEVDVELLKEVLVKGADINAADEHGNTALHLAAIVGKEASVLELVRSGAKLDERNQDGRTPLNCVCIEGHLSIIKILVDARANVGCKAHNGSTPLYICAEKGHLDAARYLLDNGAAVDDTDMVRDFRCCAITRLSELSILFLAL
ncbi:unnamed protein product [Ostreobium quekettii]|uniref:Uncharacterized protein n=1 Tax=Ostreobium quekettii TaxID=121088 RepID=A0A8S1J2S5_9CHLO|nr:unnamed protein product [Ostreobium quekettii]